MATVSFILDKRTAKEIYPLKMRISHGRNKTALIGIGIKLREDQWDGKSVINHIQAEKLTAYIGAKRTHAEGIITNLKLAGSLDSYSVTDLKKIIENNGEMPVEKSKAE